MSSVNIELFTSLKNVRSELAALAPGDAEKLSKIGAAIEGLLTDHVAELPHAEELLILCLTGLQKIYEDETADFTKITEAVGSGLVAVEQSVASKGSEVCEAMIRQASSLIEISLDRAPEKFSEIEPYVPARLETLDDIAALLMQIGGGDTTEIENICCALKAIIEQTQNVEHRKMLIKATRDLTKIVNGKTVNASEILERVGEIIGCVNGENEYASEADDKKINADAAPEQLLGQEIDVSETVEKVETKETVVTIEIVEKVEVTEIIEKSETIQDGPNVSAAEPTESIYFSGDDGLLKEFIVESLELIEAAESSLLALENDPENVEAINTVFRAFHSVKGTSAFLGLKTMTDFAHLAESLLSRMRDREIRCTGGYADLALRSVDVIKEMLQAIEEAAPGTSPEPPADYEDLIKLLANPEEQGISGKAENQLSAGENGESNRIGEILVAAGKVTKAQIDTVIAKKGDKLISEALIDEGLVTWEEINEALKTQTRTNQVKTTADSSVRVRTDRLDSLIDMVGELVIAQSMLAQDATVAQGMHHELSRKISHAGKIVRELQDLSMAMRMIPLKGTFQKMTRIVRDVAQKCGKQIDFVTVGEDTEIDRNMVDIIGDPLVHMVRNAADHGIEIPFKRTGAGKSATGKINLSAYHAGGDVVVELADDGAGLDREKILAKAVSLGLIESDKGMSENQIFNLIFAPGFSTVEQITDVSGRGVGMDVVKRNIEGMRGRIEISSEKGKGSLFTVRLPLTLAITDGMLVRVGAERFIVPTINIHLSFRPTAHMLSTVAGRGELVSLRGELMPIFRLHKLFEVENAIEDPTNALVMIVADGRRRCALMVDELLGQYQVVAKTLGQGISKIPGVSGGAILGDGCVGLILDVAEIVAVARRRKRPGDRVEESSYRQAA